MLLLSECHLIFITHLMFVMGLGLGFGCIIIWCCLHFVSLNHSIVPWFHWLLLPQVIMLIVTWCVHFKSGVCICYPICCFQICLFLLLSFCLLTFCCSLFFSLALYVSQGNILNFRIFYLCYESLLVRS